MTDLKKKNFYWSCLCPLLRYYIVCFISVHFCFRKKFRSTGPFFWTHPTLKFTGKKYSKFYSKILPSILPTKPGKNKAFTGFSFYRFLFKFTVHFTVWCKIFHKKLWILQFMHRKNWLIFFERPTKLRFSSMLFILYTFTISVITHQISMF